MKVDVKNTDQYIGLCTFCKFRHSCIANHSWNKPQCDEFELGDCFKCRILIGNDGDFNKGFIDGKCIDNSNDFGGCDNFQPIRKE